MHSEKKLNKEDTWGPGDLRRHIREEGQEDDYVRKRDYFARKHRGGESTERRPRDPEKESRREREKYRERESTREGRHGVENDRYADRQKEGSQDRRVNRDRDRGGEMEREKRRDRDRLEDGKRADEYYRENRDRRQNREEKHYMESDKERLRDKEKVKESDRERHNGEDREKRRDDREKERRREEQDRGNRSEKERMRYGATREVQGDVIGKHEREKRKRHKERQRHHDEYQDERNDRERRERHRDKKHSELKEEREHRRHKEERERRHTEDRERRHTVEREKSHNERGYQNKWRKHDGESREHRHLKGSDEEDRRHRGDRERDRDRHKERRHRERAEEELERNHHKDRTSSSKKTEKSNRHETKTEEVSPVSVKHARDSEETVVNAEDQAEQEYEDDFEKVDYEEDFEEMDESADEDEGERAPQNQRAGGEREELAAQRRKEIKAIQRAMDEENERVGTAQSRSSTSRDEEDEPKWMKGSEKSQCRASHCGKFIDFVAAKKREVSKKVATKQKKRSTELLRLIDLDFSMTFSHLDLPPVNEYDMYIKSFGTTNTKQAYAQCNEDSADRDIQTEEIEVCEKWTQHPPEKSGACGDQNLSKGARDKTMSDLSFDSQRLTTFLHSASQVMVILLEEDQAEKKSLRKLKPQTDTLSFSGGSLQLNTNLPFLYGRHVSLVHFSQVQRYTVMSVHDPTSRPSAVHLDSCTIICIWNIRELSRPQKILVYESEVQCCCFSPGKAILVFAGTSVGSVVLWDLRENASNHLCAKIAENKWTFRQPTFSTDAVMVGPGHFSPVTSVEVVPSAVAGGLRPEVPFMASEEELSGLSFQLASLDESGVLNFWVVVELPKANEAGSPTDLGLRPGGKVKLLHSSSLLTAERVSPRDAVKTGPSQTLHLKFVPTDSSHFFIGTNMGLVNHGTSHGLKAPPKFYRFQEAGVRPVDVTSINFSPFLSHLFLVGCGDGSIRLHTVSHEKPVAEWTNGTAREPVVSLQWTQIRPTVFCALDTASNLRIWDLMKNDTEPVVTERIHSDRVTAMAVFGDSGQQNTYSGIALAHESGKIELQYFARNFTVPILAEEDKLKDMISEAF